MKRLVGNMARRGAAIMPVLRREYPTLNQNIMSEMTSLVHHMRNIRMNGSNMKSCHKPSPELVPAYCQLGRKQHISVKFDWS